MPEIISDNEIFSNFKTAIDFTFFFSSRTAFKFLFASLVLSCWLVVVITRIYIFHLLQYFTLNSKGEIKSEDNCLDFNGYDLYLRECDNLGQNQKWEHKVNELISYYKKNLTGMLCYFQQALLYFRASRKE